MCGIVGYIGGERAREHDALTVIIDGLRRLEYRGYDSAGVAVMQGDTIACRKKAGKVADLEQAIAEAPLAPSNLGIGPVSYTHLTLPTICSV